MVIPIDPKTGKPRKGRWVDRQWVPDKGIADLHCKDISCGNCVDYIHIGENMRQCALKIAPVIKSISNSLRELSKPNYDAQIAIMILRDYPEVQEAGLKDLAWAIYQVNAHKNDVLGFIEDLEKYLVWASETCDCPTWYDALNRRKGYYPTRDDRHIMKRKRCWRCRIHR